MAWRESYEAKDGKRYKVRWREAGRVKTKGGFVRAKDADAFKLEIERKEILGGLYHERPLRFGEFAGLEMDRDGNLRIDDSGINTWYGRYRLTVSGPSYTRRRSAAKHLASLTGTYLDRITPALVNDTVLRVASKHPRTGIIVLDTIKMILRDARVRGQQIDEGVMELDRPFHRSRAKRFLTWAQVCALADASKQPRLIRFAALTGLRQHEVFDLTDADVALGHKAVTVRMPDSRTKKHERTVPLTAEARRIVKEQQLARPAGTDRIFPAPRGGRYYPNHFNEFVLEPARTKAGLSDVTFHDLRHTFASLMIGAGTHPKMLQELMGHSSIKVTMDTYGHLYEGADEAAMSAFERFLSTERTEVHGTDG